MQDEDRHAERNSIVMPSAMAFSSRAQPRDLRFLHVGYTVGLIQTSQVSNTARPGAPGTRLSCANFGLSS